MDKAIVTPLQLDLPINYLELSEDIKSRLCKKIVEQSLAKMTVRANIHQKIQAMNTVLQRSIEHNVAHEYYEMAAILRDVKNELQKYANDKITPKEV